MDEDRETLLERVCDILIGLVLIPAILLLLIIMCISPLFVDGVKINRPTDGKKG